MASDIDFDELDKAVSSLLGGKEGVASDAAKPVDSPTSTPNVPANSSTPAMSQSAIVLPPASRRSGGRFMDIRPGARPTSSEERPAMTTTPIPAPSASQPVPAAVPSEPDTKPAPSAWPDPIDFMSQKSPSVDEAPAPEPVADDLPATVEPPVELNNSAPVDPPTSPFLPDAKVEKRPLGSFVSASLTSGDGGLMDHHDEVKVDAPVDMPKASDSDIDASDKPVEQAPVTETSTTDTEPDSLAGPTLDSDTPMPAELQQDVLSLESDEVKPPVVPARPAASPATPTISDSGPTSIIQQYREKPSTDTPPSGAIYDTEAYHKPIVAKKAPAKKGVWKIVLWVLLLIIVGAGVGAAVYFFVLPLLK